MTEQAGGREKLELVLRQHLPVPTPDHGPVLCICDLTQTYDGPVGHRLHVADALLAAVTAGYVEYGVRCPDGEAAWRCASKGIARESCLRADQEHDDCRGRPHKIVQHTVGPWEECRG